uniref:Uncharacterized protein n=1 Tax=Aegilops tauschii subsp. strangulata TaxID=200361 RepID=A0A453NCE6_AEGTS
SAGGRTAPENAEAVADFVADKMNRAWIGFGSAPEGSVKRRIHSFGLKLLSRVRPSETLLKSLTKDVSMLEIVHPASINPRLVRRRLRHIAVRGAAIHKKYLYGSICMLPVTSVFMGSERLHLLVSDCSGEGKTLLEKKNGMSTRKDGDSQYAPWNFQPSQKLDGFLERRGLDEGLDCDTISRICQTYDLDKVDVLKYRDLEWPSSASRTT